MRPEKRELETTQAHAEQLIGKVAKGMKLRHMSEYLTIFWTQIQAEERDRNYKLRLLQAMAGIKFSEAMKTTRVRRREQFNKDHKKSAVLKRKCFVCDGEGHHRHHIIQLQHGGKNIRRNVVVLCRGCHSDVHGFAL